jgi:hypothetical protein
MERNEIKVGQIVLIDHDPETLHKVIEVRGGLAILHKLEEERHKIEVTISNLKIYMQTYFIKLKKEDSPAFEIKKQANSEAEVRTLVEQEYPEHTIISVKILLLD